MKDNLISLYNRNRKTIWFAIIICIFVIFIIRVLNAVSAKQLMNSNKNAIEQSKIYENIYNQNESVLFGEDTTSNTNTYNDIITEFLDYCVQLDIDNAYNMLSDECKSQLYSSKDLFKVQYLEKNFNNKKIYNFQNWRGSTYEVNILDNILSTGGIGENIRDYYTVVRENGEPKLNINGFIGTRTYDSAEENEYVNIELEKASQYMEYAVYQVKIKNKTDKNILIDSQTENGSIYAINENETNFVSFLDEFSESDLMIEPYGEKEINIKFNISYSRTINIKSIVFSDIILDVDKYKSEDEKIKTELKIYLD